MSYCFKITILAKIAKKWVVFIEKLQNPQWALVPYPPPPSWEFLTRHCPQSLDKRMEDEFVKTLCFFQENLSLSCAYAIMQWRTLLAWQWLKFKSRRGSKSANVSLLLFSGFLFTFCVEYFNHTGNNEKPI